jgi:hypothetical protein
MFRIPQHGSGPREPNQCGFIRIQIQVLVTLCHHKKLDFDLKNIGTVTGMSEKNTSVDTKAIFKGRKWVLLIWVNFLAPRSGFAFPLRIRIQEIQINADP